VSEDPVDPGPRQEEVIRRIDENVDTETAELDAAVEAVRAQDADNFVALGVAVASRASTLEAANIQATVDAILEQQTTDHAMITAALDAQSVLLAALTEELARQGLVQDQMRATGDDTHTMVVQILDLLTDEPPPPPPPPSGWQDDPRLMPDPGSCVFGVYDGHGENLAEVTSILGRTPGLTTLYWPDLESPEGRRKGREADGRIVRVDFEWTTAMVDAGYPRSSLWRLTAAGEYDTILRELLPGAGRLASWCHEADLSSEQGGAGTPEEFAQMWRHVITIAREVTPETLWFWNMSGGRGGDVAGYWGTDVTDEGSTGFYPGHAYVDFVGWDPFDWYGVRDKARTSFASAVTKFGRVAWYEKWIGTDRDSPSWRPLMIGETAVCETEPGDEGKVQPADEWLDDAREWVHAHPYLTHLIYFSVLYEGSHDRRLTGGPEKRAGLEKIGADPLLV
jgi:hypothetical protein